MYKNQYLVSDKKSPCECNQYFIWNGLHIHLGESTDYTSNEKCLMIGKAAHSLDPKKRVKDIISDIAGLDDYEDIIKYIDDIAGRYIILFKVSNNIVCVTDACAFKRGLFTQYNGHKILTSSEKFAAHLMQFEIEIKDDVNKLINDSYFKRRESPWFGLVAYDERFKLILPNHCLYWNSFQVTRLPVPNIPKKNRTELAALMLKNTLEGLAAQYKLIQPITAGIDSRILLAASKDIKDEISYYVFSRKDNDEDTQIARQLSTLNNNSLAVIQASNIDKNDSFMDTLENNVIQPRALPKTANIYYHLKHTHPNSVNINGNGSEVCRLVYGSSPFQLNAKQLAIIQGVDNWPLLSEKINDWFVSTNVLEYANKHKLSVSDLFYWEQRMPLWGATYPLEQDIAIDEVSPFSNRKLIYTLLREPVNKRKRPQNKASKEIISYLNSSLNDLPFNPDSYGSTVGRLRIYVKRNPVSILLARRLMSTFK